MDSFQTLVKIATRYYPPASFEMAYEYQVRRMPELFGFGMSNVIIRFDGKKMDVFRVKEDMEHVRPLALALVSSQEFSAQVSDFERRVREFIDFTKTESATPRLVVQEMSRLYVYSAVCFFVSNTWESFIDEDKRQRVLEICMRFRAPADDLMAAYIRYIESILQKNRLSHLVPFAVILGDDAEKYSWMDRGFIFSDGDFFQESWESFLQRKGYVYVDEVLRDFSGVLKGRPAFPGSVTGRVSVLWSPKDMETFPAGNILVASMTTPTLLPVVSRVAAIVTDEGGATCHAAIVARELCVPCVVGTKNATQVLRDDDMVIVDATKGTVRKISE